MSEWETRPIPERGKAGEPSHYGRQMRATATKLTAAERAKGIRRVATPTKTALVIRLGKSAKCRVDKSTGDVSGANHGIAVKHQITV